eukprot:TRINITY_DN12194_c0_g1_i1.p1 TRINITY_DN12194_c0_g1~~TRINITY_DN12194_c0_g1_i1.p1  ORF type:complete len:411 (+),score=63.85 TRINITY_DN12194_c0_g1_i1:31-1233(+)
MEIPKTLSHKISVLLTNKFEGYKFTKFLPPILEPKYDKSVKSCLLYCNRSIGLGITLASQEMDDEFQRVAGFCRCADFVLICIPDVLLEDEDLVIEFLEGVIDSFNGVEEFLMRQSQVRDHMRCPQCKTLYGEGVWVCLCGEKLKRCFNCQYHDLKMYWMCDCRNGYLFKKKEGNGYYLTCKGGCRSEEFESLTPVRLCDAADDIVQEVMFNLGERIPSGELDEPIPVSDSFPEPVSDDSQVLAIRESLKLLLDTVRPEVRVELIRRVPVEVKDFVINDLLEIIEELKDQATPSTRSSVQQVRTPKRNVQQRVTPNDIRTPSPLKQTKPRRSPPSSYHSPNAFKTSIKGFCIGCQNPIDFDPDSPLCKKCKYTDIEYRFCHKTGDSHPGISLENPCINKH